MNLSSLPFKIIIKDDSESLSHAVVDHLEIQLRKRLNKLNNKSIGLATGRTMIPIYRTLVARLKCWASEDLEHLLENWISFNLDEYVGLPKNDEHSFRHFMKIHLAKPLGIKDSKIRTPLAEDSSLSTAALSYSEDIISHDGISFQLLGLGNNGHIGFNEPPSDPLSKCRIVELSTKTRMQNRFGFNNDINKVPSKAITLGLKEILAAKEIHLIVTGREKSEILHAFITKPCSDILPASWLKTHNNLYLWADKLSLSCFYQKNLNL